MPNEERIDSIISEKAFAQVEKLEQKLIESQARFVDLAEGVNKFNDSLAKSKSTKEFTINQEKAALAVQKLAQEQAKTELIAIKLEQTKDKIAKQTADRLLKEEKLQQSKTKTVVSSSQAEVKAYEDSRKGLDNLTNAVNENDKATAQAANAALAMSSATKTSATSTKELTDAESKATNSVSELDGVLTSVSGTLDQNIKRQIELKLELSQVTGKQKDLKKEYEAGNITQAQYIQKSGELEKQQVELKQAIQSNNTTVKQSVKENQAAATSYDAQSAKLDRLRKAYNGLSQEEKENAQVGGVLKKSINDLDKSLKDQDKSVGITTRNVGNYQDALSALPGPIGGVVSSAKTLYTTLLANPIGIIVAALFGLFKILQSNDEAATFFNGVLKAVGVVFSNIANAISQFVIPIFKEVFSLFSSVIGVYAKVYDSILSIIPGYDKLKEKIQGVVNSTKDAVSAAIEYEAVLDDLEDKQKKLEVQEAKNNLAIQNSLNATKDSTKSLKERVGALDEASRLEEEIVQGKLGLLDQEITATKKLSAQENQAGTAGEQTRFKILELEKKKYEALLEQSLLEGKIAKRRDAFLKEEEAAKKKAADEAKKIAKEKEDAAFSLAKTELEIQRDTAAEIRDDVENNYDLRIAGQEIFYKRSKELRDLQLENDLRDVAKGSDKEKELRLKYNSDLEQLRLDGAIAELNVLKSTQSEEERVISESYQNRLDTIEAARDTELLAVVGNDEKANEIRRQIQEKYLREYIQAEINAIEEIAKVKGKSAEDEKNIAALRLKYAQVGIDKEVDASKEAEKLKAQFKQEAANVANALIKGLFDSQLSSIENEKKETQDKYDQEREQIEKSTESEAAKRVRIEELDKRDAEKKKRLAEEEGRIKTRQAKLERAIAIGQIIAKTAQAVTSQLSIPVGGFALAAAAAAIGAIQIGLVLAQPLPKYAKGGVKKGTGPAMYGELGTEMYVTKDGKMGLTPSTPTIGIVEDGTKIISNSDLKQMVATGSINDYASKAKSVDFNLDSLIKNNNKNTGDLKKALNNRREQRTVYTKEGLVHLQVSENQRTKYINRNLR